MARRKAAEAVEIEEQTPEQDAIDLMIYVILRVVTPKFGQAKPLSLAVAKANYAEIFAEAQEAALPEPVEAEEE